MYPLIYLSIYWSINLLIHQSIDPSIYLSINISINLSIHQSIYPSIYLSINLSIHQYIYPSIYLSINISIHQSINPSIYRSINLSIHQFIYPSIYLSINLSIYLSIWQSKQKFVKFIDYHFQGSVFSSAYGRVQGDWEPARHQDHWQEGAQGERGLLGKWDQSPQEVKLNVRLLFLNHLNQFTIF